MLNLHVMYYGILCNIIGEGSKKKTYTLQKYAPLLKKKSCSVNYCWSEDTDYKEDSVSKEKSVLNYTILRESP